ncbi:5'-nucleotidase [Halotalea alkalilenta]|uniref:5'-nucleotidase n=1 Tax=Halotalea alkalilenta TaxID=376489 RepID=UPI000694B4ED|nr:5'-nucleotidase [Halotalea alkalilenta]
MPYDLSNRLVIGLASSALFDLADSDAVFVQQGEAAYRAYQRRHENEPLAPGVAFAFIKRLLALRELDPLDPPIEVLLLSRNDPDTGLRVMKSIEHHQLAISRAVFLQGRSPYPFIPALNISLFLSANPDDVRGAIAAGYPAGQVMEGHYELEQGDELRVAFDFDGVLTTDESESIYQTQGIDAYHRHERAHALVPAERGLLADLLQRLSTIQALERRHQERSDSAYVPKLRVSIVTARDAPAHERVIHTMREWGITVNEAFFLGGVDKSAVLKVVKPHIFFDDQTSHLAATSSLLPSVHVPFGRLNRMKTSEADVDRGPVQDDEAR